MNNNSLFPSAVDKKPLHPAYVHTIDWVDQLHPTMSNGSQRPKTIGKEWRLDDSSSERDDLPSRPIHYKPRLTHTKTAELDETSPERDLSSRENADAQSMQRRRGCARAMGAAKEEKDKEMAIDAEVQSMMDEDDRRTGANEPTATFAEIKPGITMDDNQELADMLRKHGFGKKTSGKEDEVIDPIGQAWRRCDLEVVINKLRAKYGKGKEASSKQAIKKGDEDLGAEIEVLWPVADAKFMKTVQARKDKVSSKEQAEKLDAMAESRFKIWFSKEIIALEEMK